ncbi:hypothetical protein M0R45_000539 [Rubus argutus]|uniref:DUF4283 domain-containing protein n=1 Tax=Rubus argutus TaxID=59490 RepID=A0AAW1VN05_RUBAR
MSAPSPVCPWSFLAETTSARSYASVATQAAISISDLPLPVIHDGKTIVTISEDGYQAGMEKCRHMLLGRLQLASNDKPYSPSDLQRKLGLLWGDLSCWKLIPMGKGFYSFSFATEEAVSRVWAKGAIALKPGTMRFMKWVPNFSPANQRNTNAQVWVKFWNLGLEFWEPRTLFEIASGVGVPVKIDPNTLDRKFGLFARVLVDVDLSSDLPVELVVRRKNGESIAQGVEYEQLPDICSHCGNVGHRVAACKHVGHLVDSQLEPPRSGRGRSRKRRSRAVRKRAISQVYVMKQSKDKAVVIAPTPPPILDCGEGPSFVHKSPAKEPVVEEQPLITKENMIVPSAPHGPIQVTNVVAPLVNGQLDDSGHMEQNNGEDVVAGVNVQNDRVQNACVVASLVATDCEDAFDSESGTPHRGSPTPTNGSPTVSTTIGSCKVC